MSKLQTKIEGRGNGIKTVIPNMSEVAKALRVDPDYITKFFGYELGCQSKYERGIDCAFVTGAHDTPKLVGLLDKFIELFVCCPKCNLPEIRWDVNSEKEEIQVDCTACGNHSPMNHGHKLISYICKEYAPP
jgi:translation initiation factor 5